MRVAATRRLWWGEHPASSYDRIDPDATVAVLPISAVEQHGPHLPLCTDQAIMEGMLETVAAIVPSDVDLRILPVQAVGKSDEHLFAAGTLSLPATTLIDNWTRLGALVAKTGVRKLVIVNSHGGNEDVMGIVARNLRVAHGMLVGKTSWFGFGYPAALFSELEIRDGIHGGDIETSLMLHFRPDLVDMALAENFRSAHAVALEHFKHLRPVGRIAFAWEADDLHPSGAVGNAAAATAEKGRETARYQAEAFVDFLRDMRAADLSQLLAPSAQRSE